MHMDDYLDPPDDIGLDANVDIKGMVMIKRRMINRRKIRRRRMRMRMNPKNLR